MTITLTWIVSPANCLRHNFVDHGMVWLRTGQPQSAIMNSVVCVCLHISHQKGRAADVRQLTVRISFSLPQHMLTILWARAKGMMDSTWNSAKKRLQVLDFFPYIVLCSAFLLGGSLSLSLSFVVCFVSFSLSLSFFRAGERMSIHSTGQHWLCSGHLR